MAAVHSTLAPFSRTRGTAIPANCSEIENALRGCKLYCTCLMLLKSVHFFFVQWIFREKSLESKLVFFRMRLKCCKIFLFIYIYTGKVIRVKGSGMFTQHKYGGISLNTFIKFNYSNLNEILHKFSQPSNLWDSINLKYICKIFLMKLNI